MRLRALLPFRTRPTRPAARRVHLRCETLEGREIPSANLMGVNLSGVEDWAGDRMFADAMKSARRPSDLYSHQGNPPVDAKGWPTTDASIVVWHGIDNMHGTYQLSFTGQADIAAAWGSNTISNKRYDAATNTTTATLVYYPTDKTGLRLDFKNTRRTPAGPTNTGVTNIKLMRPVAPGSATSYDPSVTFTQPLKDLVQKFSVVRMMDNTGSNGWQNINGNWNLRRPADYSSQAATGAPYGMAWEYAIQFWNETDTDAWVNIPFPADEAYIRQLATLLKNNLEPGRKLYVEYSNELWNSWGPFPANANREAAIAEVRANPNSPLNFDGIYPAQDQNGWALARRRIALRAVQVSNIFRDVFGGDQMMSRVRPVLMSQLGWTDGWLAPALDFMEDYFNSPAYQTTPRPASYYLYGAGGSAYQEADWSKGANTTVDDVFNTMPKGFNQYLQDDINWVAAFGLQRIAYEGGPSLDNMTANQSVPEGVLRAAWSDPRMRTEMIQNHHTWTATGGDLLMYFSSSGDYHWGLTDNPANLNTQKLSAIDELNRTAAVPVTIGKLAPGDLTATDFRVGQSIGTLRADSLTEQWSGAVFRVDAGGKFALRLTGTTSAGGRVEIFVDGKSVGTADVPAGGTTASIAVGTLAAGEHGIVLRARAGTFGLSKVSVLTVTDPEPPTPPDGLSAAAVSSSSVRVGWTDRSNNETGFMIERADDPNFATGRATFAAGANATAYTDASANPDRTYYYRIRALNGTAESAPAGPASCNTPAAPSATGLLATYFDNVDLTGPAVTRTDATVNFNWPDHTSPAAGIASPTYSVRWLGQVEAAETGYYRFRTESDDGVRLWVNGKLVINNWTDHAGTFDTSTAVRLRAGQRYDVRMEFYNRLGGAVARLQWKPPGPAAYDLIPTTRLTPAAGGAALFADGFDTGTGSWTPASGRWTTARTLVGRGSGYVAAGSDPERLSLAGDTAWTNYSVAAWVKLSSLGGGVSVLGRVVDATHYYQLSIQRGADGRPAWSLTKRDGDTWTTLATGSITYAAGQWVRLRLTMNGTNLRAEASTDGTTFTQLGSATDGRYARGRIGLRSWNATAQYDEVVVQTV